MKNRLTKLKSILFYFIFILNNTYLQRNSDLEEELKKSKNYIQHLERKIKLVFEENKVNKYKTKLYF